MIVEAKAHRSRVYRSCRGGVPALVLITPGGIASGSTPQAVRPWGQQLER